MTDDFIWFTYTHTIPAALSLLPSKMDTVQSTAQLLAIALQESGFRHRTQVPSGHAHGLWQFEKEGGVKEVLTHHSTMPYLVPICDLLLVPPTADAVWKAIVHNDILACCLARCLLYIDPRTMPFPDQYEKGWRIYVDRWRPGKPHPSVWPTHFNHAWDIINSDS